MVLGKSPLKIPFNEFPISKNIPISLKCDSIGGSFFRLVDPFLAQNFKSNCKRSIVTGREVREVALAI